MEPGTIVKWHDLSSISYSTPTVVDNSPIFMTAFSCDKGTEALIEINADDFNDMYGKMDFAKHGQSAIQAQNIVDNGGRLFCKRVVAEDSTLANIVFVANATVDDNNVLTIKWTSQSITGCKTFKEVKDAALNLLDAANGVFPLVICSDNGRGVSKKAIRLNPDYLTSSGIGKMFYALSVYEGTGVVETTTISINPETIYSGKNYSLDPTKTAQISGYVDEVVFNAYAGYIANALGLDIDTVKNYDLLNGYTCSGKAVTDFVIDQESVNLNADTGILLAEGTNGSFGDAPVGTTAWTQALVSVFDGTFSNEIYDLDQHKVCAILDANYPDEVKNAIFDLVTFREDCVFFRDYGLGMTNFSLIQEKKFSSFSGKNNKFTSDYVTSYYIEDPNTLKNIEVTMLYDMAAILPGYFNGGGFAPLAGQYNGFVLPAAIKGTLSFTPVITPAVNQKSALDNLRVNYCLFEEAQCVVQSCYTSQAEYTQLSYTCNVTGIQTVVRAVRSACPKSRFAQGSDLSQYEANINKVLEDYIAMFNTLRFTYTGDRLTESQKIFHASIEFAFLNWAQTEYFDVYAINAEE